MFYVSSILYFCKPTFYVMTSSNLHFAYSFPGRSTSSLTFFATDFPHVSSSRPRPPARPCSTRAPGSALSRPWTFCWSTGVTLRSPTTASSPLSIWRPYKATGHAWPRCWRPGRTLWPATFLTTARCTWPSSEATTIAFENFWTTMKWTSMSPTMKVRKLFSRSRISKIKKSSGLPIFRLPGPIWFRYIRCDRIWLCWATYVCNAMFGHLKGRKLALKLDFVM